MAGRQAGELGDKLLASCALICSRVEARRDASRQALFHNRVLINDVCDKAGVFGFRALSGAAVGGVRVRVVFAARARFQYPPWRYWGPYQSQARSMPAA